MALALFGSKDKVGVPAAGDWRCMGCNELMLAKYPNCRKCGEAKPESADLQLALAASQESQLALTPLDTANSPIIAQLNKGEDWACPLCKEVSFANRPSCRRCGCPRPEGAMVVQTVQHQLSAGGYIGYLPDVSKIEATSSWAKQWNGGPMPGQMNLGMMQMTNTPFDPDASFSSSGSSTSSSSSDSSSSSASKAKKKQKTNEEKKEKGANKSDSSASGSEEPPRKKQKEASEKKDKGKESDNTEKKVKKKSVEEKEEGAVSNDKAQLNNGALKKAEKQAKKEAKSAAKAKEKAKIDKKRSKAMDVEEELEKRRLQRERRKARTVTL